MTNEFISMLHLFGCGATGRQAKTQYCENLSIVRKYALEQEVWDIVYIPIREKLLNGEIRIPKEILEELEMKFAVNVAANIQRVEFNLAAVRKILDEGIKCAVIKGSVVAALYAAPEARISSDTDILINEDDEKKVCDILLNLGYELEERSKYDHHRKAYHKTGGLLEVHIKLHSEATREFVLDDEIRYDDGFMETDGGIYTLSVRDGLVFLTAHLIKHFINDGIGVRQIMDLLLYMKKYDKEIDWEEYNALIKKLSYDRFIKAVKGIGVTYFDMEFDDAITEGDGIDELIDDMEKGGLFGSNEKDRKEFYFYYTKQRSKTNNLEYTIHRLTKAEKSPVKMLFPSYKGMVERYNWLKKVPLLLPFMWIYRLFKIVFNKIIKKEKPENLSDVNKRRIKMMEKLGMVKE